MIKFLAFILRMTPSKHSDKTISIILHINNNFEEFSAFNEKSIKMIKNMRLSFQIAILILSYYKTV